MAVEFNEQEFTRPGQASQTPGAGGQGAVTGLIMKLGLAKNLAQANIVMIAIAALAIALTIYLALPIRATPPNGAIPTAGQPTPLPDGGP